MPAGSLLGAFAKNDDRPPVEVLRSAFRAAMPCAKKGGDLLGRNHILDIVATARRAGATFFASRHDRLSRDIRP